MRDHLPAVQSTTTAAQWLHRYPGAEEEEVKEEAVEGMEEEEEGREGGGAGRETQSKGKRLLNLIINLYQHENV